MAPQPDSLLPRLVERAYAAAGSFSVFRNNADTTFILANGSEVEILWDTIVTEHANIDLQADGRGIVLNDTGKYLVLYNAWAQDTSNANSLRRSFESYLTINESPLEYGRAAGFIRDTGSVFQRSYTSGAAVIAANAGDTLKINIRRDDTNNTQNTRIRAGVNGVSIVQLRNDFDYARLHASTRSASIAGNTTFTPVQWDTVDELDTDSFGFSNPSSNITLKGSSGDYFMVTANVRLNQDAGSSQRQNYEMRLALDGTEIPGTKVTSYIRGNANSNGLYSGTLVYTGLIRKTSAADQVLTVGVRRESTASAATDIVADETAITLTALPSGAAYASLRNGASHTLSSTRTAVNLSTQVQVEAPSFSHNPVTNSSRLEIDEAGNYLFFSTSYSINTSGTLIRDTYRADWRRNGSSLVQYGGHGSYSRAEETFSAGSSGGVIIPAMTATDYLELTILNEDDPSSSAFAADAVALQGVSITRLMQSDIIVSAAGTAATSALIPATNLYAGGKFIVRENSLSRTLTGVTINEQGSVDAATGLNNIKLYYDVDTTAPYDCVSESYSGAETQFGSTDTDGFSGPNGSSTFTGSVNLSPTRAVCLYVVYDVTSAAVNEQTASFSISNPTTSIVASDGPSIEPVTAVNLSGSTQLVSAALQQTTYRWLSDDGAQGAATPIAAQGVVLSSVTSGNIYRLRTQVSTVGSTTTPPTAFTLQYAVKSAPTCADQTGWVNVGTGAADWNMANSVHLTDGVNATNISTAAGGVTDPAARTFLATNGGIRDTTPATGAFTLTPAQFVEFEYAIEPAAALADGSTYCFRMVGNGGALSAYQTYPEATMAADVVVHSVGNQIPTTVVASSSAYLGGLFSITRAGSVRTLTSITLREVGSIDAAADISNVRLYYDLDTTAPYNCASESRNGSEPQFGSTAPGGFSAPDGTLTFTGSLGIRATSTACIYIVSSIAGSAGNGDTVAFQITDPAVDVVVSGATVGPSSPIGFASSTTVVAPTLTQTHYHWRHDDGSEAEATSATGGVADTPLTNVVPLNPYRLRVQVSNEGGGSSQATNYQIEYATKVTTCETASGWTAVGASGGAWAMHASPFITDGNTTDISEAVGGMTNENSTFVGTGALRQSVATSGPITLSTAGFTELEYSLTSTLNVGFSTTYCFRVTASGVPVAQYGNYAELTTKQRKDFFIQRGTAEFAGGSLTLTAGSDYEAPADNQYAFVRITGTQLSGSGNLSGGGTRLPSLVTAHISDQSDLSTDFTITRPNGSGDLRVDWEIVEYIGLPGGDNEIIVRDVEQLAYAGGTALVETGSVIPGIADDEDVVVFITGQYNAATNAGRYDAGLSTSAWLAGTNQPQFTRAGQTGAAAGVSYAVVEFTGANWKIQRAEHAYIAAGTTETETITAVNSLARTFLHAQKRVPPVNGTSIGIDEVGHQVWLSSIGAVSFQIYSTASSPSSHVSVVWVVENLQTGLGAMEVFRSTGLIAQGGPEPDTRDIAIGATIEENNASLFVTNDSSGTGTALPRGYLGATIISPTQYRLWRSDNGQNQTYRTEVVSWPVAEISIRQNYYRFYANNDMLTPTDPWPVGATDVGENTSITAVDGPLSEGDIVRLRMSLRINNASQPAAVAAYKLQYGLQTTTCGAVSSWTDVGAPNSGDLWRGVNGSVSDGTTLDTVVLSVSDVAGSYEGDNPSVINPHEVGTGQDVEYDWAIQHNGAVQRSNYCFRMVEADGDLLTGYFNYPVLRTSGYTPVITNWRWYGDEASLTPSAPLAGVSVAPASVANEDVLKLRVLLDERENTTGSNVKFTLQYSEYADFSDGGTTLTSIAACTASSTWCYADAAGVDNDAVSATVLPGADSCVAGVGNGCGTHNETASSSSTHTQPGFSKMEFEFAVVPRYARTSAVYYFRLFDTTNDEVVLASSTYPSVVIEGPSLTFAVSGVAAGTVVAGETTTDNTSSTLVDLSIFPDNSSAIAAQNITVDTNAVAGYQVLQFVSNQLVNDYGDELLPISSTNAAPAGWAAACQVAASSCTGYHTTDATLAGGSSRFAPLDSYAAFHTAPIQVMYSSVAASESHQILYRAQASPLQPAGDYLTNVTYIAIPTY